MTEHNIEIFINRAALDRGRLLMELIGKDPDVELAVRDGSAYALADAHCATPEAVVDYVVRFGRDPEYYRVGLNPFDETEFSPWFPTNLHGDPRTISLALEVIRLREEIERLKPQQRGKNV